MIEERLRLSVGTNWAEKAVSFFDEGPWRDACSVGSRSLFGDDITGLPTAGRRGQRCSGKPQANVGYLPSDTLS